MNVVVLGKSRINDLVKRKFNSQGIEPVILEDIVCVDSIKGQAGSFVIGSKTGNFGASYIVVTEDGLQDYSIPGQDNSALNISLDDDAAFDKIAYSSMPAVLVLDYPVESPAFITRLALEKAIKLARRRRKVVYLARFMRTAGDGLESLYKEARNLGVVFFKYDDITIEYQNDEEVYKISVKDPLDSLEIVTHTPVIAGNPVYSNALLKMIKLLKLKLDNHGHVNEDSFTRFPSLTSRRGIYFLNMKSTSGSDSELEAQMQYILSEINDTEKILAEAKKSDYAEIDSSKCAFCYTCYRACPHYAMAPDYENSIMKNVKESCYGCGICFSVCPANAITMVKGKDEQENNTQGTLKLFCCENSGEIAYKRIAGQLIEKGIRVDVTPAACGGELSVEMITSALKEYDRVLVAVCMDNACRHFDGNKRARNHVERAKEILRAAGIDENKVLYMQLSHAMPVVLDEYIMEMV